MSSEGKFCVIAAVNSPTILSACLARSPDIANGKWSLITFNDCKSASIAYNAGLSSCDSPIVVFAHQDVYLPSGWFERVDAEISIVERSDPNWAVLGVFGLTHSKKVVGRVWSTGLMRELDFASERPEVAASIDELVIILRRASGIAFDANLPGFHLYGTDIVTSAYRRGNRSYVINAPVVHNSKPVKSLRGSYERAYDSIRMKYRDMLPIETLICQIGRFKWSLRRAQWRSWRRSRSPVLDTVTDASLLAQELGYESPNRVQ